MPLFVFRSGVAVAVPTDYARDPQHRVLVDRLTQVSRYAEAVAILEQHPDSWLAADVLTGAPWAQRFLTSTAHLSQHDPAQARRGTRALFRVLNGAKPRHGRPHAPPLPPDAHTVAALARWRADLDGVWPSASKASLVQAVARLAAAHFPFSAAHRRALVALVRRTRLRKHDLVLTLVSWETGVPLRRLRAGPTVSDLVYR